MASPSLRPLIVERDADFLRLIKRGLAKAGVSSGKALCAYDGDEAIRLLFENEELPSFVTLDLRLTRRTGLEVLGWIRATPRLETLPVYVLTVDSSADSVARALELGVTSYLLKPASVVDLEGLLEGIVEFERRRESRRSLV